MVECECGRECGCGCECEWKKDLTPIPTPTPFVFDYRWIDDEREEYVVENGNLSSDIETNPTYIDIFYSIA